MGRGRPTSAKRSRSRPNSARKHKSSSSPDQHQALGTMLASTFVKTSGDPFSRASFAPGTHFRDNNIYAPGTATMQSLEHSRCPRFSNPERETGWNNRKPVWDAYIPDMRSVDGRIGQTEPFIKRNSTNANWVALRAGSPKKSPLLFNNSLSWNRRHYEPDGILQDPAELENLSPSNSPKLRKFDIFCRPPVLGFMPQTPRMKRPMPTALHDSYDTSRERYEINEDSQHPTRPSELVPLQFLSSTIPPPTSARFRG